MENNNLTIEPYLIIYSNWFEFDCKKYAFRKKELFDITNIPKHVKKSEQGWWIGRKLLSPTKAKELIKEEPITKDVTDLQWFEQEKLNHVF
jgi:hypothetical protein